MDQYYPFATELVPAPGSAEGGWCILLASLHHRVYPRGMARLGTLRRGWLRARMGDYLSLARGLGWSLHPYLRQPYGAYTRTRDFAPRLALSPSTHEALFGPPQSFPPGVIDTPEDELAAVCRRLDARDGDFPNEQPLLLTRRMGSQAGQGSILDGRLETCLALRDAEGRVQGYRAGPVFRLDWADLWLFPDAHGLTHLGNATLALKVVPLAGPSPAGGEDDRRACRVGDLAELARVLRDLDLGPRGSALVRPAGSDEVPRALWQVIGKDWLGVEFDIGACVAGPVAETLPPWLARLLKSLGGHSPRRGLTAARSNLLLLQAGDRGFADRYNAYAKVLMAAMIATPGGGETGTGQAEVGLAWDLPLSNPAPSPLRVAVEQTADRWSAEQSTAVQARAVGYPSLGDVLLYELASTSAEGSALGLVPRPRGGKPVVVEPARPSRAWCVDIEYLRKVFDRSAIEVWADWKGLALRDTCAFLAWNTEMPIVRQAEERYYPLYLHAYYTQLRLHDFSEGIIEHELADLRRARVLNHAFMQFRNQYWLREPAANFQGIAVADSLREGMGLNGLYESVAAEVERVGSYVDQRANAGRQQLIALLIFFMWPLGFLWDARAEWLKQWVQTLSAAQVLAGSIAFVVSTVVLYLLFAERIARWMTRLGDWLLQRGA